MNQSFLEILPQTWRTLEWYDNSTLSTIDKCYRKGFWKNLFILPQAQPKQGEEGIQVPAKGIAEKMGNGANFGSCIHEALDKLYSPIFSHLTYAQRRLLSMRAFSSKYAKLFPEPELVETKYSHVRGLDVLDMYFDRYEEEDNFFKVLETEIVMVNVIQPAPDEPPFVPFLWIARSDGIVERLSLGDYMIFEHKTSTSPDQELNKLRLSRQVEGYTWSAKQFPHDKPIAGVLANVIATRAAESDPSKLFFRDYIPKSDFQVSHWRIETIRKVLRWRAMIAGSKATGHLFEAITYFDRNTEECTRYGKCSFYDLCLHGPRNVDLDKYEPNTWNPLYTETVE